MQPKMTTEQLLIIGNGFDLACGLKSKYTDFFDSIPEKHIAIIFGIIFWIV